MSMKEVEDNLLEMAIKKAEMKIAAYETALANMKASLANGNKTWRDAILELSSLRWYEENDTLVYGFRDVKIQEGIDVMRTVLGFKHSSIFTSWRAEIGLTFLREEPTYEAMKQALLDNQN